MFISLKTDYYRLWVPNKQKIAHLQCKKTQRNSKNQTLLTHIIDEIKASIGYPVWCESETAFYSQRPTSNTITVSIRNPKAWKITILFHILSDCFIRLKLAQFSSDLGYIETNIVKELRGLGQNISLTQHQQNKTLAFEIKLRQVFKDKIQVISKIYNITYCVILKGTVKKNERGYRLKPENLRFAPVIIL